MRWIKLRGKYGHGKRALIDNEDYARVSMLGWHMTKGGYVMHDSKLLYTQLHRFILQYYGRLQIDHINHRPWDNRRKNLRVCTPSVNGMNRKGLPTNNTTGYLGVCRTQWGWQSYVTLRGIRYHLGYYGTAKKAAKVRADWLLDTSKPVPRKSTRADNTSGASGVFWNQDMQKWEARVWRKGESFSLGWFTNVEDARVAREAALAKGLGNRLIERRRHYRMFTPVHEE